MAHASRSDAGDRIRVLGPVEIVRANRPVSAGSPRQRALLALLALSVGVAVPPSRLVDLLWGDAPPPSAGNTVQVYVSRLRRLLAAPGELPPLRTVSGMYLLDLPPEAIDSRRFEEASESGRSRLAAGDPVGAAHELRSALQLWRGSTLPDLAGVPGAVASVARLQSLRLSTLADRIDAESLLGRHSRLIPELQDLVRKHPLHERFVGQLMTSLYWEGRQAEALATYAAAAGRLVDEFGIDPGPALRDLHGRLLRQEVGPIPTAFTEENAKTDSGSVFSAGLHLAHLTPGARGQQLSRSGEAAALETEFGSRVSNGSLPGWIPGPRTGDAPIRGRGTVYPGGSGWLSGEDFRPDRIGGGGPSGGGPRGGEPGVGERGGVQRSDDDQGGGIRGNGRQRFGEVEGGRRGAGSPVAAWQSALLPGGFVTDGQVSERRSGNPDGRAPSDPSTAPTRIAPVAYRPGPPNALPVPPAVLPVPPVIPGGPIAAVQALEGVTPVLPHPSLPGDAVISRPAGQVVPKPPTLSVAHCAPILPGVPDTAGMPSTGGIASIGTKRTAFGAAFGAGTIGRTGELGAALDLLRRPDVRLVTVVGPGGAGKTRLAAQVVARKLGEVGREGGSMLGSAHGVTPVPHRAASGPGPGPSRVLVIPLGEWGNSSRPDGLAGRLRRVLGVVPDTPGEPAIDTVCRALAATPCLLVLDDLDVTFDDPEPVAAVMTLLSRVGGLRVLATARRVLGVPGEQVIGLGPLPMPWAYSGADDVETVRSSEAVRLFRERARAVLPAFEVTEQNADAVSGLCRALDGLPLALELAAARSRGRAPAGIGEELGRVSAKAAQANKSRQPGSALGSVLDWTVQLLDETERLVLSQLSVFVGGATLDAAERVCGPVPGPGQVIDVIGRLADKNLLLIDETGRLGMLSPVREHARALLAADPAQAAACADRHAAYFAEFADALPPMTDRWLDPGDGPVPAAIAAQTGQLTGLSGRAVEHDNLAVAAAHAEGRDGEVFTRLVVALLDQGMSTGRWELGDAPAWLTRAQAQRPTARSGARLLLAGGSLALFGGNPLTAAEIFARVPAGATSGEAGVVVAIRVALMRAVAARTLGRSEQALAELEGAVERLRAVRRLPDVLWHAVLNTLADVLDDLGRTAQAIGYWQRSRHRAAAGADPARLAYPLAMLAQAAQDRGDQPLARVLIEQACSAAAVGGPAIRASVAVSAGVLELREGNDQAAADSLRTALREAHQGGRFFTLPRIAGLLGVAHRHQEPERAAALLAASSSWCAQRSISISGRRERDLICAAETELTHASSIGQPSDSVRRSAARGAAIPFGSLTGLLRLDPAEAPDVTNNVPAPRLIDLTEGVPRIS